MTNNEIDNIVKECATLKKLDNLALIIKLTSEAYDLEKYRLNNQ